MQAVRYFLVFRVLLPILRFLSGGDVAVHATIVNKRSKHQSADCFFMVLQYLNMYKAKIRVSFREKVDELMFEMEFLTGFVLLPDFYIIKSCPFVFSNGIGVGNTCRGYMDCFVYPVSMFHGRQLA